MGVTMKRRGLMLILSSPSGAGKTTLSRRLLETDEALTMSVSATTRPKRPNELHGQDYFFVSAEEFARMEAGDEFLEHATVFGNSYGTPRGPVMDALADGHDVLFDIDWQGTQQLKQKARDDVVSIFVLPPSRAELEHRLKTRGQDSDDVVAQRMAKASDEISHWAEYDYVIVNDEIIKAQGQIEEILDAERLRRARQTDLADFVAKLMRD